jgi:hypothetical protein
MERCHDELRSQARQAGLLSLLRYQSILQQPHRAPGGGGAVGVDDSAAAMKAKMAELEDSAATKTPDDSLDLRGTFVDRRNEQKGDAGADA